MSEQWRQIFGWNYEVSCHGRVRNASTQRVLKPQVDFGRCPNTPYHRVMLSNGKKRKFARVHRLVAEAFHPNPEEHPHVDHVNANSVDNRAANLEWVTVEENLRRRDANR